MTIGNTTWTYGNEETRGEGAAEKMNEQQPPVKGTLWVPTGKTTIEGGITWYELTVAPKGAA